MRIPDTLSNQELLDLAAKASKADIEVIDAEEYTKAANELIEALAQVVDRMDRIRIPELYSSRTSDFARARRYTKNALRHIKRSISF